MENLKPDNDEEEKKEEEIIKKDPVKLAFHPFLDEEKKGEKIEEEKTFDYFMRENKYLLFKMKSVDEFIKNSPSVFDKMEALSDTKKLKSQLQEVGKSHGLSEVEVNDYIKRAISS